VKVRSQMDNLWPMATSSRVFELRTYHVAPGKFDVLQTRFRDHALGLFEKHGLDLVAFWTPTDRDQQPPDTLVYLLAFAGRDAADEAWTSFRADPAWIEAKAQSELAGPLVTDIESTFFSPTEYSPLR
jgi:hypothetical protein